MLDVYETKEYNGTWGIDRMRNCDEIVVMKRERRGSK